MDRVILHCDINSFYASVEDLYHPETRGMPVAVGGDVDKRHGIILAKNQLAKQYGIKTGEAIWQAKLKCPHLVLYSPNYERYMLFSRRAREMFHEYTDLIEPFGLDEAWLDVTHSGIYGTGKEIADKLRERIFNELGVTASVGVSYNKIFAKLGSDLRKPNYTTVLDRQHVPEMVWPLAVEEMIYVGRSTQQKLNEHGIFTIGELAHSDLGWLKKLLGKAGETLWIFANGYDDSEVSKYNAEEVIKSIGNSVTCYRDLNSYKDLDAVMLVLAESVASRMRDEGFKCREVTVYMRDNELKCRSCQMTLSRPTNLATELLENARYLYRHNYFWEKPLRSVGIKAGKLITEAAGEQLSLFEDHVSNDRELILEKTIDDIRSRYGFDSIKRSSLLLDPALTSFNPKGEHVIFPESYFK